MSYFTDVEEFNQRVTCIPGPDSPGFPPLSRMTFRLQHLHEELEEIETALVTSDLVELADGLADLIYVALGFAHESGIDMDRVWAEVHRANMSKVRGTKASRPNSNGVDAIKPTGWKAPDHAWLLSEGQDDIVERLAGIDPDFDEAENEMLDELWQFSRDHGNI